jgi:hypothetical protein
MRSVDTINRVAGVLAMPPTAPTVVVVDDDISVRESLELLIQNEGWQPALFESAQEFLARLPGVVASCLILDIESRSGCDPRIGCGSRKNLLCRPGPLPS